MKNNKIKPCELALENLREELRKGILDGSIEIKFEPYCGEHYFADATVWFAGIKFRMSVGEHLICYHNEFIEGLFDGEKVFGKFQDFAKKNCKILSESDKDKIRKLKAEIEKIRHGKI